MVGTVIDAAETEVGFAMEHFVDGQASRNQREYRYRNRFRLTFGMDFMQAQGWPIVMAWPMPD